MYWFINICLVIILVCVAFLSYLVYDPRYNGEVSKVSEKIKLCYINKDYKCLSDMFFVKNNNVNIPKSDIRKVSQSNNQNSQIPDVGCKSSYYKLKDYDIVWKNPSRIKVFIKGSNPKNYIFNKCFEAWNKRTNGFFGFEFVNSANEANIVCSYVNKFSKTPKEQKQTGYTESVFNDKLIDNKKYLIKSNIEIILKKDGITLNDAALCFNILHEIGHALGIMYHSPNSDDIMREYFEINGHSIDINNCASFISPCDIEAMRRNYEK